jgi:maltooligosyltrehalose trehalohydrolase
MMRDLRIWAPRAEEIEVVAEGGRHALRREGEYFVGPAPTSSYMLLVDGSMVPDPLAPVVEGVLGPCQQIDLTDFRWTDRDFRPPPLSDGVLYELHVGTFTPGGTFDSAAAALSSLAQLGITHVELMPVATFSGSRGWGYDGAALFAPHPTYGGPSGLQRFVDAAHRQNLAVILDVVYNHLGPIGNFLEHFGPFFREDRLTPWGSAVNLDGPGSDGVRRFFIDNALGWLRDYHIDGLRLDAIHALHDASAHPFLQQLCEEVARLDGSRHVIIAESDLNDPRVIRTFADHGHGCHAAWCDDFHHALHVALTGESSGYYADFADHPLNRLVAALEHGFIYDGQYSHYRERSHGAPLGAIPLHRLVGYAQNHDQIGNRARGDRLAARLSSQELQLAMTLVMTAPFVPLIFMGEEWGATTPFAFFSDHQDPEIATATRTGRRREFAAFGWAPNDIPDPQAYETFVACRLRWRERELPEHAALLEHTRRLIALRRSRAELRDGRARAHLEGKCLVMERGPLSVVLNFSNSPANLSVGAARLLIGDDVDLSGGQLALPGHASAIVER